MHCFFVGIIQSIASQEIFNFLNNNLSVSFNTVYVDLHGKKR